MIDWENYATIGIGRPQELITAQTLENFRGSLALVIGIMGQRFGSSTGEADSGTQEELNWAFETYQQDGFPEIKFFFRRIDRFVAQSSDPDVIMVEVDQLKKVRALQERLRNSEPPLFYGEFTDAANFAEAIREDLSRWLADPKQPWIQSKPPLAPVETRTGFEVPESYFRNLYQEYYRLDISGIDNDKAFEIPLSQIYVRLRVIFEESERAQDKTSDTGSLIDIQTALGRYGKLVIVGDPGSGKSTFVKYIALMIARSILDVDLEIARETLCIGPPLPLPFFLSCWDLSDYMRKRDRLDLSGLVDFMVERAATLGLKTTPYEVLLWLEKGECCLLFDGLDEVPTDQGRALVSRLLEQCVGRYGKNRYVVTSRIRAYTGDTILRGEFARCDIQPFNADDRRLFLGNWVSLLFKLPRDEMLAAGTRSRREFDELVQAIESGERIRELAVNPLLLTVIAIVHWNRKRLPEQRVDLYDECVDVLLGQRKEAELARLTTSAAALDTAREAALRAERAWVRKRFAEIALLILSGGGEEVTKADVVALLRPRFRDLGAVSDEQATSQAEIFLEHHELRSGLLVSRRANSYRFVHLTFEEYLSAWHLSNQEFSTTSEIILPHLREQVWFETLQLLGGEWAKQSDEKLNQYIEWLLAHREKGIRQQAPIIALAANVVKDTAGIAELKSSTRETYEGALRATLYAFKLGSGVSNKIQLEILEALGGLGASVESHLIAATKSTYYDVRKRAIEMLVPHLPDDDLFDLAHVLSDKSQESVFAYMSSLAQRDVDRTIELIRDLESIPWKAALAYMRLVIEDGRIGEQFLSLADHVAVKTNCRQANGNDLSAFLRSDQFIKGRFAFPSGRYSSFPRRALLETLARRSIKEAVGRDTRWTARQVLQLL